MTREEKIEFIINSSPHSEQEVLALAKGMNDESLERWYQIEAWSVDRQLEKAMIDIA
ncbi:hypothetical protein [Enterococcus plantarum]|uniref:hypothetical protein n=1 Tax=Enterococcus plantarum TaxID=1077675 RepID=UPI0015E8AFA6|nr:hypothetical protein [Enterococcus plantarum]